jgi:ketopantoate reductase
VDGVIFATKGHDLNVAAQSVATLPTSWVFGVQNGLRKDRTLGAVFGADRVLGGVSALAAERASDGLVHVTSPGMTYVGELKTYDSGRCGRLVACLARGGVPAEVTDDPVAAEWAKVLQAAPSFARVVVEGSLGALPGWGAQAVWGQEAGGAMELAMMTEIAAIAASDGVTVRDFTPLLSATDLSENWLAALKRRMQRRAEWSFAGWEGRGSIVQDMVAGRRLEAGWILEDLVRRAKRADLCSPWIALALALSLTIEAARKPPSPCSSTPEPPLYPTP